MSRNWCSPSRAEWPPPRAEETGRKEVHMKKPMNRPCKFWKKSLTFALLGSRMRNFRIALTRSELLSPPYCDPTLDFARLPFELSPLRKTLNRVRG